MRIEQMNPYEKWPVGMLGQPGERMCDHLSPAALDRVIAVFSRAFVEEAGIVEIETSIEALCASRTRVQYRRPHESSRVIPVGVEDFGEKRNVGSQRPSKIGYLMKLRIGSGQNGGM